MYTVWTTLHSNYNIYSVSQYSVIESDPTGGQEVSLNCFFSLLTTGVDDKKQTDSVLDSFEYFLEKGKEKEDDLHKSYNDRSYLSSEELGPGESRTGEQEHP